MANSSAEEMTLVLDELSDIKNEMMKGDRELAEIKRDMIKKDDMKEIVTSIVQEMMKTQKEEFETRLQESDEKNRKEREQLTEMIEAVNLENETLKKKLSDQEKRIENQKRTTSDALLIAKDAQARSNYNEQYSRKTNIKIYGVKERDRNENSTEVAIKVLKKVAKVELMEDEIIAAHRIPGRADMAQPILVKVKNSEIKARVMKKRSVVKKSGTGVRIADDVTVLNTKLLERLNEHRLIDQAWYFNGNIYAMPRDSDTRVQFDIHDDIERKLRSN